MIAIDRKPALLLVVTVAVVWAIAVATRLLFEEAGAVAFRGALAISGAVTLGYLISQLESRHWGKALMVLWLALFVVRSVDSGDGTTTRGVQLVFLVTTGLLVAYGAVALFRSVRRRVTSGGT